MQIILVFCANCHCNETSGVLATRFVSSERKEYPEFKNDILEPIEVLGPDQFDYLKNGRRVEATRKGKGQMTINVFIEIPKGSRNKYEYDEKKKVIRFDRMLFSAVHYPSDYGFIPETLAEDGDPLDALVMVWEPTFPGCLIEANPIGVFKMWDEKGSDEKILCVPVSDPNWNHLKNLKEVPPNLLKEIEHFFAVYKDLEQKKSRVGGWDDKEIAIEIITKAQYKYQTQIKSS